MNFWSFILSSFHHDKAIIIGLNATGDSHVFTKTKARGIEYGVLSSRLRQEKNKKSAYKK
jgi:hypothetical protein